MMSGSIVAASWLNFRRLVPPNDEKPIASAIAGSISMSSMVSVEKVKCLRCGKVEV